MVLSSLEWNFKTRKKWPLWSGISVIITLISIQCFASYSDRWNICNKYCWTASTSWKMSNNVDWSSRKKDSVIWFWGYFSMWYSSFKALRAKSNLSTNTFIHKNFLMSFYKKKRIQLFWDGVHNSLKWPKLTHAGHIFV